MISASLRIGRSDYEGMEKDYYQLEISGEVVRSSSYPTAMSEFILSENMLPRSIVRILATKGIAKSGYCIVDGEVIDEDLNSPRTLTRRGTHFTLDLKRRIDAQFDEAVRGN